MKRALPVLLAIPAALGVILAFLIFHAKRLGRDYWIAIILGTLVGWGIIQLHALVSI